MTAARAAVPSPAAALLAELEQEAGATRRLLAAVPAAHLDWTPHARSMTLRRLAGHVAEIPGRVAAMLAEPTFDFAARTGVAEPASTVALAAAFDESLLRARAILSGWTERDLAAPWRAVRDGRAVLELPRGVAARTVLLNHFYHHRGQLTVYLRMLDVPLPSVYGPTADENPFD